MNQKLIYYWTFKKLNLQLKLFLYFFNNKIICLIIFENDCEGLSKNVEILNWEKLLNKYVKNYGKKMETKNGTIIFFP